MTDGGDVSFRSAGPWPPEVPGLVPENPIGSGGSGTVWKCRQEQFLRWVAVKIVDTRLSANAEALFARECSALGNLSGHPNIVPVYSGGLDGRGRPYLVMPFIETGSLADVLEREGPIDWQRATELTIKIAGALQAAHDAEILHRDVKPENILVTKYGEAQLADFGIARIAGAVTTMTNTITATPIHAAPEVLNGKPSSERSDVYSLASTLYRLITGLPAFHVETDETLLALLFRIATQEPAPLTELGVPPHVAAAVHAGMVKDPEGRTQSAAAFRDALTTALAKDLSGATPEPVPMPEPVIELPEPVVHFTPGPLVDGRIAALTPEQIAAALGRPLPVEIYAAPPDVQAGEHDGFAASDRTTPRPPPASEPFPDERTRPRGLLAPPAVLRVASAPEEIPLSELPPPEGAPQPTYYPGVHQDPNAEPPKRRRFGR